jgi:hypothetical protein
MLSAMVFLPSGAILVFSPICLSCFAYDFLNKQVFVARRAVGVIVPYVLGICSLSWSSSMASKKI